MTDTQSNVDLVLRGFAAATGGDWSTVRSLVRDDFTWHIPGHSRIAGDAVGIEAFAAKLQMFSSAGLNVEVLNVFAAGDHVATLQRNSAVSEAGELDILVISLFTVLDGKVARMQTFPSDQYALDRFWGE
jgi:uncharacterized protein